MADVPKSGAVSAATMGPIVEFLGLGAYRARMQTALNLELTVIPFGNHGLLMATSEQMPNLRVTGTGEDDLWDCIPGVITGLLEVEGSRVVSLSMDRTPDPRLIKVFVRTAEPAQ